MATHGFEDVIRRRAYDRNTGALVDLFAAPDSVARIQAMAAAHHRSALADLFARLINWVTKSNRRRTARGRVYLEQRKAPALKLKG